MKYLMFALVSSLLCTAAFSQTNPQNKQTEPVSLSELARRPMCGTHHIQHLTDNIKAAPQNTKIYIMRAYCYQRTKNPEFFNDLATIINLNPQLDSNLYNDLKSLIFSKDPEESKMNLSILSKTFPNHWLMYALSAKFKNDQGDYKGAYADNLKTIELTPLTFSGTLVDLTFELQRSKNFRDAPEFYEPILKVWQKKQLEIKKKLIELPNESAEYKRLENAFAHIAARLMGLTANWAERAFNVKDARNENAALEMMVKILPLWQSYRNRSAYYARRGNSHQAREDETTSIKFLIESKKEEIKKTNQPSKQAALYLEIGDLYFRIEQYVKAIDSYETAKSLSGSSLNVERKIRMARVNLGGQM